MIRTRSFSLMCINLVMIQSVHGPLSMYSRLNLKE